MMSQDRIGLCHSKQTKKNLNGLTQNVFCTHKVFWEYKLGNTAIRWPKTQTALIFHIHQLSVISPPQLAVAKEETKEGQRWTLKYFGLEVTPNVSAPNPLTRTDDTAPPRCSSTPMYIRKESRTGCGWSQMSLSHQSLDRDVFLCAQNLTLWINNRALVVF